ncbi:hypothetical protein BX265_5015 [Streptomyces sp. TLI_235]|nr:hypothetical protein BX265_4927 [Streptomyces sp. TLI_235]PBC80177.1 hypothetical protein BX265_5015 [Streptomyces sp. TLI_235]
MELHGHKGYVPWRIDEDREHSMPGIPHSHWTPSREHTAAWCDRENGVRPTLSH